MTQAPPDVLDPPRSQLRALAASVDKHLIGLSSEGPDAEAVEKLKAAWLALSKALALGSEPVLRSCPSCTRRIPCEATRCRYCMAESRASRSAATVDELST